MYTLNEQRDEEYVFRKQQSGSEFSGKKCTAGCLVMWKSKT